MSATSSMQIWRRLDEVGDNETYNLARGIGVSDFEIFDAVPGAADSSFEPRYAPVRPGEAQHISLDSTRAMQVFS